MRPGNPTSGLPVMLEPMKLIATSQISNALTVGTSTDCSQIFVGNFSNLFFMMRESLSVQVLTELYAGTGEIGFACHMRADVMVTYPGADQCARGRTHRGEAGGLAHVQGD